MQKYLLLYLPNRTISFLKCQCNCQCISQLLALILSPFFHCSYLLHIYWMKVSAAQFSERKVKSDANFRSLDKTTAHITLKARRQNPHIVLRECHQRLTRQRQALRILFVLSEGLTSGSLIAISMSYSPYSENCFHHQSR